MKPITEQERRILDVLLFENKIDSLPFIITEEHILAYMHGYVNVLRKKPFNLRSSDYRYNRKLAALTLLKYLYSIGVDLKEQPSGFVYLVENDSFPEHYKSGMTTDLEARLNSYQTYDPYRGFKVKKYEFVLNRRHAEKLILNSFGISIENGEWVKKDKVENIFKKITFKYSKVLAR
jgi:hypothetical protein